MFDQPAHDDHYLFITDADDDIEQILSVETEGRWRSAADLAHLCELAAG